MLISFTKQQLKDIMPLCDADQWTDPISAAMERFEINSPKRKQYWEKARVVIGVV